MAQRRVTSGIFRVPDLPAALGPALHIMVVAFSESDAPMEVPFTVYRVADDGMKVPIQEGSLAVRGEESVDSYTLKVWQVEGSWVEVQMDLPHPHIVPTAAVGTHFIGDDSTELELWISPAEFAERP